MLQTTGRVKASTIQGYSVSTIIALAFAAVILLWTERSLWTSIRRLGKVSDALVAVGIHLAVLLGIGVATYLLDPPSQPHGPGSGVAGAKVDRPRGAIFMGVRLGATYMGYVVLAKVLGIR